MFCTDLDFLIGWCIVDFCFNSLSKWNFAWVNSGNDFIVASASFKKYEKCIAISEFVNTLNGYKREQREEAEKCTK